MPKVVNKSGIKFQFYKFLTLDFVAKNCFFFTLPTKLRVRVPV